MQCPQKRCIILLRSQNPKKEYVMKLQFAASVSGHVVVVNGKMIKDGETFEVSEEEGREILKNMYPCVFAAPEKKKKKEIVNEDKELPSEANETKEQSDFT